MKPNQFKKEINHGSLMIYLQNWQKNIGFRIKILEVIPYLIIIYKIFGPAIIKKIQKTRKKLINNKF